MPVVDPVRPDEPPDAVAADLATLRAAVHGPVFAASDPETGLEVAAFNAAVLHRPVATVGATSAHDVAAAVRWATAHGLPVAVQSTGHGALHPVTGAVVVTTGRMNGLSVDPAARTARIEAGVRWAQVIEAAAPHGLAPLSGSSPGIGAIGYTLGGGSGNLAREYGFAADHVRWLELVTADGGVQRVDADSDPDLFWALRGGKGNLGIVTALEMDLVPVAEVYGGALYFDAAETRHVLHAFREWTRDLPEQATTSVALMRMPDIDIVPEPLRGRFTAALRFAYAGPGHEGEALLAPMTGVGAVLMGEMGMLPYPATDLIHADPVEPVPFWDRGGLLRELSPEAVDTLLAVAGPDVDVPLLMVELRLLGGALGRPAAVPNAVAGREGAYTLSTIGLVAPGTEDVVRGAGEHVHEAMASWTTGTSLLNLLGDARTPDEVARAWHPDVVARLRAIKAAVDPQDVFRFGDAIGLPT